MPVKLLETPAQQAERFQAIHAIAEAIAPHEATWRLAWANFDASPDPVSEHALKAAVSALNDVIEPHVKTIAELTPNSEETLRQAYRPKDDLSLWFTGLNSRRTPSAYLHQVARHQSFNETYWVQAELEEARAEISLRVVPDEVISDPADAARAIKSGNVPHVDHLATQHRFGLSVLEKALIVQGVLEPYGEGTSHGQVSATRHFGFVEHAADGASEFVFWPEGRASTQIQRTPVGTPGQGERDDAGTAPRG